MPYKSLYRARRGFDGSSILPTGLQDTSVHCTVWFLDAGFLWTFQRPTAAEAHEAERSHGKREIYGFKSHRWLYAVVAQRKSNPFVVGRFVSSSLTGGFSTL